MDRLIQWLTAARAMWFAALITVGAIGTGIGFLLGEGAARASFAALIGDHEKRLTAAEKRLSESEARDRDLARETAATNTKILEGLAELKGEVKALRREVRP
jgi:hypothetical protein